MKRNLLVLAGVIAAVAGSALLPAGDARGGGGRARFDFAAGEISCAIVGHGADAANYYLSYTLTNPMDEARTPRISLELTTDTGHTYGDRYDARVTAAAEKSLRTSDLKSAGALRSTEMAAGSSVHAVANFGPIDPNADEMTVRVRGLWDPIVRTRQGRVFKESRLLVLKVARQGDEYDRPQDPISIVSKSEEREGDQVELYSTTKPSK